MSYAANVTAAYAGEFRKYCSTQYVKTYRIRFCPMPAPRDTAKRRRRRKLMRYMDIATMGPIAGKQIY